MEAQGVSEQTEEEVVTTVLVDLQSEAIVLPGELVALVARQAVNEGRRAPRGLASRSTALNSASRRTGTRLALSPWAWSSRAAGACALVRSTIFTIRSITWS